MRAFLSLVVVAFTLGQINPLQAQSQLKQSQEASQSNPCQSASQAIPSQVQSKIGKQKAVGPLTGRVFVSNEDQGIYEVDLQSESVVTFGKEGTRYGGLEIAPFRSDYLLACVSQDFFPHIHVFNIAKRGKPEFVGVIFVDGVKQVDKSTPTQIQQGVVRFVASLKTIGSTLYLRSYAYAPQQAANNSNLNPTTMVRRIDFRDSFSNIDGKTSQPRFIDQIALISESCDEACPLFGLALHADRGVTAVRKNDSEHSVFVCNDSSIKAFSVNRTMVQDDKVYPLPENGACDVQADHKNLYVSFRNGTESSVLKVSIEFPKKQEKIEKIGVMAGRVCCTTLTDTVSDSGQLIAAVDHSTSHRIVLFSVQKEGGEFQKLFPSNSEISSLSGPPIAILYVADQGTIKK